MLLRSKYATQLVEEGIFALKNPSQSFIKIDPFIFPFLLQFLQFLIESLLVYLRK